MEKAGVVYYAKRPSNGLSWSEVGLTESLDVVILVRAMSKHDVGLLFRFA